MATPACVMLYATLRELQKCCAWTRASPKSVLLPIQTNGGPAQSTTETWTGSNSTFVYCIPSNDVHFWLQRFSFLHSYVQILLLITERSTAFTKMLVCFHAIQHRRKNQSCTLPMHIQSFSVLHRHINGLIVFVYSILQK